MNKYNVIWKGKVLGTYSFGEIKERVSRGQIGLMYMVECAPDNLIFVRDFLLGSNSAADGSSGVADSKLAGANVAESPKEEQAPKFLTVGEKNVPEIGAPITRERAGAHLYKNFSGFTLFIYALCGGAFLSAYLYVAALLLSFIVGIKISKQEGVKIAALSSAMFFMGVVFFEYFLPTLET